MRLTRLGVTVPKLLNFIPVSINLFQYMPIGAPLERRMTCSIVNTNMVDMFFICLMVNKYQADSNHRTINHIIH